MIFCGKKKKHILVVVALLSMFMSDAKKKTRCTDRDNGREAGKQAVLLMTEICTLTGQGKIFEQSNHFFSCIKKLAAIIDKDLANKNPRAYLEGAQEALKTVDIEKLIKEARFSVNQKEFVKGIFQLMRKIADKALSAKQWQTVDQELIELIAFVQRYENVPDIRCWIDLVRD